MATGDSFRTLSARFRVGVSTVHNILVEICTAIWDILHPKVMPEPIRDDWIRIEQEFAERWNFLNCIGSLDSKHIIISPAKSVTPYYNYKGHFSIDLMALVDVNYKFLLIDIRDYGSNADGAVFLGNQLLAKDFWIMIWMCLQPRLSQMLNTLKDFPILL